METFYVDMNHGCDGWIRGSNQRIILHFFACQFFSVIICNTVVYLETRHSGLIATLGFMHATSHLAAATLHVACATKSDRWCLFHILAMTMWFIFRCVRKTWLSMYMRAEECRCLSQPPTSTTSTRQTQHLDLGTCILALGRLTQCRQRQNELACSIQNQDSCASSLEKLK